MRPNLFKWLLTSLVILSLLLPVPLALASSSDNTDKVLYDGGEAQPEEVYQLTLITGDVITVVTSSDGQRNFAISPAQPEKLGQHFLIVKENDNTYIIPDGADLQKLDRELFNINYLIKEKYYEESSLPLLVTYLPSLPKSQVELFKDKISTLAQETKTYEDICTISVRLAYKNIADSYNNLISQPEVEKIWLDKKIHATLFESVPLIEVPTWWDAGYNGTGVQIAILDTGIDSSHPALDDLDDDPTTNDPKVIVNVNFNDDPSYDDLFGHGTHCAGIAAGTSAGTDYQGVAPGAWLWNVKVLNQYGWGYISWIIDGINFASLGPDYEPETGDEADIISMSLGGWPTDGTDPLSQAVNNAVDRGLVVTVAAGNDGPSPFTIATPGVAEKAFTVGASDKEDKLAWFSSQGPTIDFRVKPDILAPGVDITSSVPGEGYESYSGTSMSTPHVAGAAALLLQAARELAIPALFPWGDSPDIVKNVLMSTAKDLGYNVYEQGSGRIDLSASWQACQDIAPLITPASLSLGHFTSEDEVASGKLTFSMPSVPTSLIHKLALSPQLIDIITGDDYSSQVSLSPASFEISSGEEVDVTLNVDLTSLPASVYSGKVTATVDGGESQSIHAIFGFSKLNQVTVHKTDINGNPAEGHPVLLFSEEDFFRWGWTDEAGNFTLYLPDGTYHVVSFRWDEANHISIWTVAESVDVSGDMTIPLDERDTKVIDFDPNKAGQIPCGKLSSLFYESDYYWYCFIDLWWYPKSFITRVSPISLFDASFKYEYYPEEDLHPACPRLVNTSEWHNLRYSVTEITDDIRFIADYDNLVRRDTSYCVALDNDGAVWCQCSHDDISGCDCCFCRCMDVPQQRQEWLSLEPVRYDQLYSQHGLWTGGEWYYWSCWRSYLPGEYEWGMGCHPLTSGVDIHIWRDELDIWGPISVDSWDNEFENRWTDEPVGHIKVTKDSEVVLEDDIYDWFWEYVEFTGTPEFTVEVWGKTAMKLSNQSYTRLDFTADPSRDYRPPRIWFWPVEPEANLRGIVPAGDVNIKVYVQDESPISNVELAYSLDDGKTWIDAGPPTPLDDCYIFHLGAIDSCFVTVRIDAQDEVGNHIRRETQRAFYVAEPVVTEAITWNCPMDHVALIAPNPAMGRPFLSVSADLAKVICPVDWFQVLWLDEKTKEWKYFYSGFVKNTLRTLEPEKYYYVIVSHPCELTIPQDC